MKLSLKTVLLIILCALFSNGFSQVNAKLGYIDSNELLDLMPGKDSVISFRFRRFRRSDNWGRIYLLDNLL
ncbi:MAG: hypothetical protein R6W71_01000 [Bacteroidales bacterium]